MGQIQLPQEVVSTSADAVAIRVQNLSKCFQIYDKPHHPLKIFVVWLFTQLAKLTGIGKYSFFGCMASFCMMSKNQTWFCGCSLKKTSFYLFKYWL